MTATRHLTREQPAQDLSGRTTLFFAVACGAIVANLYYAQPLVALIGPAIGLSEVAASLVVTLSQLGYGLGLLLLVPLGDLFENRRGSCWLAGCWSGSYDQGGNECGEQGFAATACVVHELEEAEVVRQLVLRDPAVRAQPGAQQGPETLDGVDVHLPEPIPVLVAGVLAAPVADGLVPIAPAL